jgi:hypothetical protein
MLYDRRFEIAVFALLIAAAALRSVLADLSLAELVVYAGLGAGVLGGYVVGLVRGHERAMKQRGKCPHCGTRILLLLFHLNDKRSP